ncbi:hypothetical protein [Lichenicoccus sp.]|uniref:hypothetical protein n=1 Tax=Lichenicoccus sp. TaxID=2781899 RepID=UPI003D0D3528
MVPVRRHARHWRSYLAGGGLVLALWFSTALAEQKTSAQSHKKAQYAPSEQKLPPPGRALPSYSGLIDQSACQPSKDSHQEELCIEWRSASATEAQAFWAQLTFWIGVVGTFFVLRTLHYTRVAAKAAQDSVLSAERSIAQSNKALEHAREMAARDLRPWLTMNARLTEGVDYDNSDPSRRNLEVFLEITCTNVGRVAARNVVYSVAGIDAAFANSDENCINSLVKRTVERCESTRLGDVLTPSEAHTGRYWCVIPDPFADKPMWARQDRSVLKLRVVIAVAYKGTGSDEEVFFTVRLFPVGKNLIQFLDLVRREDMPLSPKDVTLGPCFYARIG